MKGEVHNFHKNMRYKLIKEYGEDKEYILDIDSPIGSILFPFLHWLMPQKVYLVQSKKILDKIGSPVKQHSKQSYWMMIALFILFSSLLGPMLGDLNRNIQFETKLVFLAIGLILVVLVRFYLSKHNKSKLKRLVTESEVIECKLWIRPQSVKRFIFSLYYYFLFLGFVTLSIALFILHGNILALVIFLIMTFMLFLSNLATIKIGSITVITDKNE